MATPTKKTKKTVKSKGHVHAYSVKDMERVLESTTPACRHCKQFPIGAADLVHIFLLLIFTLSAVLMTSVYALNVEHQKVVELQTELRATL
ncbi:MAG: hypothetical protein WCT24_04025 [Patescibacteria group bacterium]